MKYYFLILFILITNTTFSQKFIINDIDFKLKEKDRALIEKLGTYEVKIFNGLFKTNHNDSVVLTLNLYNRPKVFKELLKTNNMKGLTESGFYSGSTNQSYVMYYDSQEIKTVLHELSHALLRNNLKNPPRWFNEGLAEFLESLEEKNNSIQVYTQHHYLDLVKDLNNKGKINFKKFFTEDQTKWQQPEHTRYLYAMSYSIVYYLIKKDPQYISKIANMLKQRKNSEFILSELFGNLQKFENNFKMYYR